MYNASNIMKFCMKTVALLLASAVITLATVSFYKKPHYTDKDIDFKIHTITMKLADHICDNIRRDDKVLIDSPGGSLLAMLKIGDCLRTADAQVVFKDGASAAPMLTLMAPKVCIVPGASVGFHSPHRGDAKDIEIETYRTILKYIADAIKAAGQHPDDVIYYMVGIMLLTPPAEMTYISTDDFSELLGDNYNGICTYTPRG